MERTLLQNSSWLIIAQVVVKVISLFYTIFLARELGVENFGLFGVALAYFALISAASDLGFNRYLIREGTVDSQKLGPLLTLTVIIRLVLSGALFLVFYSLISLFDSDPTRVNLSQLAVLAVLPQSVALTFDGVFVALQRLKLSAIALVTLSLSTTVFGVYLVSTGYGSFGAVAALVLGQIVYLILGVILTLTTPVHLPSLHPPITVGRILKGSLPYGLIGLLGLLYFRVDTILLSYLKGSYETGIYTAAYRFLEALVFIPSTLAAAAFPMLSKYHQSNLKKVGQVYLSSLKILGSLSVVITAAYLLILPEVVRILLPEYLSSIDTLKILSLTIPFMFIHVPGAAVLLSTNKFFRPVLTLSVVTLSFNVLANLYFIPKFGALGAAGVTVVSEMVSFVLFFGLLYTKVLQDD